MTTPVKPSEFKRERLMSMQSYLDSQSSLNIPDNSGASRAGPRIVEVLMRPDGPIKDSAVPLDKPLFDVWPPQILLQRHEPFKTYEIPIKFRNIDKVARRIRLEKIDHPFFKVEGVKNKANLASGRVAPGTDTTFMLVFAPEEAVDFHCEIICVTEREKFALDVIAKGARGILDLPDKVVFEQPFVNYKNEKVLLVRNLGNKATKFTIETSNPNLYSVEPTSCYLEEGRNMQITCSFTPKNLDMTTADMWLKYDSGEILQVELQGQAREAQLRVSQSYMDMGTVSVSLVSAGTIVIENRNDAKVFDFKWCQFACAHDEDQYKKRKQLAVLAAWDADRAALPQPPKEEALLLLQKRYENRLKELELVSSPLFSHTKFKIEPLQGKVWPRSSVSCQVYFAPDEPVPFLTTAFCELEGKAQRLPLQLQGTGAGPKAHLNYSHLMVGDIVVHSVHQYEVLLENDGDIPFFYDIKPLCDSYDNATIVEFEPRQGTVVIGESKRIAIKVNPKKAGVVENLKYAFQLEHSNYSLPFEISGSVSNPGVVFSETALDFGNIGFGFTAEKSVALTNLSEVPLAVSLAVVNHQKQSYDGSSEEFAFIPSEFVLKGNETRSIRVCLTPKFVAYYENFISVNVNDVCDGLLYLPVSALSIVADLYVANPNVDLGKLFINYAYDASIRLVNQSAYDARYQIGTSTEHVHPEINFAFPEPNGHIIANRDCIIPFQITVERLGTFTVPLCVYVGSKSTPPLVFHVICECIGPQVECSVANVNFDKIPVLVPQTITVSLTNNSPIPAVYAAKLAGVFAGDTHGPFSVEPYEAVISPNETLNIDVTAYLNDTVKFTELMQLDIKSAASFDIPIYAKGTGSTILFDSDVSDVDFQYLMTHRPCIKSVTLTNKGKRAHSICWINSEEDGGPSLFEVVPSRFVLRSNQSQQCAIKAFSTTPCNAKQKWVCMTVIDKEPIRRPICQSVFRAKFIHPAVQAVPPRLVFDSHQYSQELTLKNSCPLPYEITLKCPPGISIDPVSIATGRTLAPGKSIVFNVNCDENNRKNLQSLEKNDNLTVNFVNHQTKHQVPIYTSVIFPNLGIETDYVQLDGVEPGSISEGSFLMTPTSSCALNYKWTFVRETFQFEPFAENSSPKLKNYAEIEELDLFDIIPTCGSLQVGEKEHVKIQFKPSKSLSLHDMGVYKVAAICCVENGPQYEVVIQATVDKMNYELSSSSLDYGVRLCQAITDKSFTIRNTGRVAIPYSVSLDPTGTLLKKALVFPASGVLSPSELSEITVRFCTLAPEATDEPLYLHLGSNIPIPIRIVASGTISKYSLVAANSAKLEVLRAPTGQTINAYFKEQFAQFYSKCQPVGACTFPNAGAALGSPLLLYRFMANSCSIKDLLNSSLAVNSTNIPLLMQNLKPKREKRAQVLLTSLVELGDVVANDPFEIDFGHVTKSALVKKTIRLANISSQGMAFAFDCNALQKIGITIEPDRGRLAPAMSQTSQAALKDWCNVSIAFKATANVAPYITKDGGFLVSIPMYVANGLTQLLHVKGRIALPETVLQKSALDFESVLVGLRKTMYIKIKNTQPVVSEFHFNLASAEDLQRPLTSTSNTVSYIAGNVHSAGSRRGQVRPKSPEMAAEKNSKTSNGKSGKGRKLPVIKFEEHFQIFPATGVVEPFDTKLIAVTFSPVEDRIIQCNVPFKVQYNNRVQTLMLTGQGVLPKLEFSTKKLQLGPCLPYSEPAEARLSVKNPTPFPLEIIAYDFDSSILNEFAILREKLAESQTRCIGTVHEPGKTLTMAKFAPISSPESSEPVIPIEKQIPVCFLLHGPPYAGSSTVARQLGKNLHLQVSTVDQLLEQHLPHLAATFSQTTSATAVSHAEKVNAVSSVSESTHDVNETSILSQGNQKTSSTNNLAGASLSSSTANLTPTSGSSTEASPASAASVPATDTEQASANSALDIHRKSSSFKLPEDPEANNIADVSVLTDDIVYQALIAKLRSNEESARYAGSGFVLDGLESKYVSQPGSLLKIIQKACSVAHLKLVVINLQSSLSVLQAREQHAMQLDPVSALQNSFKLNSRMTEEEYDSLSASERDAFEMLSLKNRQQVKELAHKRHLARQKWEELLAMRSTAGKEEDKKRSSNAFNSINSSNRADHSKANKPAKTATAAAPAAASNAAAKDGAKTNTRPLSNTVVNSNTAVSRGPSRNNSAKKSQNANDRVVSESPYSLVPAKGQDIFLKESTYKRLDSYNGSIAELKLFINETITNWSKYGATLQLNNNKTVAQSIPGSQNNQAANPGPATKEEKTAKKAAEKAPAAASLKTQPPSQVTPLPTETVSLDQQFKSATNDETSVVNNQISPMWCEFEAPDDNDLSIISRISSVPGLETFFGRPDSKLPVPVMEQYYNLPDAKLMDYLKKASNTTNYFSLLSSAELEHHDSLESHEQSVFAAQAHSAETSSVQQATAPSNNKGGSRRTKAAAGASANAQVNTLPTVVDVPVSADGASAAMTGLNSDETIKGELPYRYTVPAFGSTDILIKFTSMEVGETKQTLKFGLVGFAQFDPVSIECRGEAAYASIDSDPRKLFGGKVVNTRDELPLRIAHGHYIVSENMFDIGPMLFNPSSSLPSNTSSKSKENKDTREVKRWMLQVTNPNPYEEKVQVGFLKDFKNELFQAEPSSFDLQPNETVMLAVSATLKAAGSFEDSLILTIRDNPDPYIFRVACQGVKPEVLLDKKSFAFDKQLLSKSETKEIRARNLSSLPVIFKWQGVDALGDDLVLDPTEKLVQPEEEIVLKATFCSNKPLVLKKSLKFETFETNMEGTIVGNLLQSETVSIIAEAYDIAVELHLPKGPEGIDFGACRVSEETTQVFNLKNKGKYEVGCSVAVAEEFVKLYGEAITFSPAQAVVPVSDKLFPITVSFKPNKEIHFPPDVPLLKCQIYEPSTEEIACVFPIKVSGRALYSKFFITPLHELDFGTFIHGLKPTKSLIIENNGEFDFKFSFMNSAAHNGPQQSFQNTDHTNYAGKKAAGQRGTRNPASIGIQQPNTSTTSKDGTAPAGHLSRENLVGDGAVSNRGSNNTASVVPSTKETFKGGSTVPKTQPGDPVIGNIGPFTVQPCSGVVPANSKVTVNVEFNPDSPGVYEESLWVDISDKSPHDVPERALEYKIIAESCVPHIDNNFARVFEEHALVSRLDMQPEFKKRCVFAETEKVFHFGPRLIGQQALARIKLYNPTKVPCEVEFIIKQKSTGVASNSLAQSKHGATTGTIGGQIAGAVQNQNQQQQQPQTSSTTAQGQLGLALQQQQHVTVFDVEPKQLLIQSYEQTYVTVKFSPSIIGTYSAHFDAVITSNESSGGTATPTPFLGSSGLSFELRGEGTLPRLSLTPSSSKALFNTTTDKRHSRHNGNVSTILGNLLLRFGKVFINHSRSQELVLHNDSIVEARYSLELIQGDVKCFELVDTSSTAIYSLEPAKSKKVIVVFKAAAAQKCEAELHLKLIDNPFEDISINLCGEGFVQDVSIEASKFLDDYMTESGATTINFGDCSVNEFSKMSLKAINHTNVAQRVSLNISREVLESHNIELLGHLSTLSNSSGSSVLQFSPTIMHIPANRWKWFTIALKLGVPAELNQIPLTMHFQKIQLSDNGNAKFSEDGWDDSLKVVKFDANGQRSFETFNEPAFTAVESANSQQLVLAAFADYARFECDTSSISFKTTMMFQSRVYKLTVKNTGPVTLRNSSIKWAGSQGPFSVDCTDSWEIEPGSSKEITVKFSPTEPMLYKNQILFDFANLSAEMASLSIDLLGTSQRPFCHFELDSATLASTDFAGIGSFVADNGQTVVLDRSSTRVVEINCIGIGGGTKIQKSFYCLNPTMHAYQFEWIRCSSGLKFSPIKCETANGTISAGKKTEMVFTFTPEAAGVCHALYQFVIKDHNILVNFLFVAKAREPVLALDPPIVYFKHVPVSRTVEETFSLTNQELLPFNYSITLPSSQFKVLTESSKKSPQTDANSGVIPASETIKFTLQYLPTEECQQQQSNILVQIRKKPSILSLPVVADSYEIHDSLGLEVFGNSGGNYKSSSVIGLDYISGVGSSLANLAAVGMHPISASANKVIYFQPTKAVTKATDAPVKSLYPGTNIPMSNVLDFGKRELNDQRLVPLALSNNGKFHYEYNWTIQSYTVGSVGVKNGAIVRNAHSSSRGNVSTEAAENCPFKIEPQSGIVGRNEKVSCHVSFMPSIEAECSCVALCKITGGRTYKLLLTGAGRRPLVKFSMQKLSFGNPLVLFPAPLEKPFASSFHLINNDSRTVSVECSLALPVIYKSISDIVSAADVEQSIKVEPSGLVSVAPGKSVEFQLSVNPVAPGSFSCRIVADINGLNKISLPAEFEVQFFRVDALLRHTPVNEQAPSSLIHSPNGYCLSTVDQQWLKYISASQNTQWLSGGSKARFLHFAPVRIGHSAKKSLRLMNKSPNMPVHFTFGTAAQLTALQKQFGVTLYLAATTGNANQFQMMGKKLQENENYGLDLITYQANSGIYLPPKGMCKLVAVFAPHVSLNGFQQLISIVHKPTNFIIPFCTVSGSSETLKLTLDAQQINFGSIVQNSSIVKRTKLWNGGDITVKFEWDLSSISAANFPVSIQPIEGILGPNSDIPVEFTFMPSAAPADYKLDKVFCNIEGAPPISIGLVGQSILPPTAKEVVQFKAPVRSTDVKSIQISNKTWSSWHLRPIIDREDYWSGAEQLDVEPGQTGIYEITFKPEHLNVDNVKGCLFFGLPDGTALVYGLQGQIEQPLAAAVYKKEYAVSQASISESVSLGNWLKKPQRFHVKAEVSPPVGFNIRNLADTVTIPALQTKEVGFEVVPLKEGTYSARITFSLEKKQSEFAFIVFNAVVTPDLRVHALELTTAVRQPIVHSIPVFNPLDTAVSFNCALVSPNADLCVQTTSLNVKPKATGNLLLEFAPLLAKTATSRLVVSSSDLGSITYDISLKATSSVPERPVNFVAALGSWQTVALKFSCFLKNNKTEFTTKINDGNDFSVDKIISITPTAASNVKSDTTATGSNALLNVAASSTAGAIHAQSQPTDCFFDVTYEPTAVGVSKAQLVLSSPTAGEYVFPLIGVCSAPVPQGPIFVKSGSTTQIPFKNVFLQDAALSFQLDNPLFTVRTLEKVGAKKVINITVGYNGSSHDDASNVHKRQPSAAVGQVNSFAPATNTTESSATGAAQVQPLTTITASSASILTSSLASVNPTTVNPATKTGIKSSNSTTNMDNANQGSNSNRTAKLVVTHVSSNTSWIYYLRGG